MKGGIEYSSSVFVAQVISAIINTTGVINATNVTINGAAFRYNVNSDGDCTASSCNRDGGFECGRLILT